MIGIFCNHSEGIRRDEKELCVVTLKQIAEHCGVSLSTASKELNGAPDISEKTIQQVRQAAESMGYMPNAAARALKTHRSYVFSILFAAAAEQGLTHEFFSRILNSFKNQAGELGYDIFFIGDHIGQRQIGYAEHARYRNCDGVLVVVGAQCDEETVHELAKSGIPLVCIDAECEGFSCVLSDNEQGMQALTEYVITQGHRRIALIHGEDSYVTRQRIDSFRRTCASHGISVPPAYIIEGLYHQPDAVREPTRRLLSLPEPPTCILYPDDISYLGGVCALEEMGRSIPGDLSTAGYDGTIVGQAFHPRLTTVRQDAESMGASAANELARIVEAGGRADIRRILVPGALIPGETVRPIAQ